LQTRRLDKSFEGLNSSLAHSAHEWWPQKNMCEQVDFAWTACINPAAKVLKDGNYLI